MGALSFAVDTLTSLSSAFASKNHLPPVQIKLPHLSLDLDDQANRLFEEFSTGMKMLYLHGKRNPCDINSISRQNVKLLYTNLKANSSFRTALSSVKESAKVTDQWTWLPLTVSEKISTGILFLPSGTTMSPNKSGANLTIHQNELQTPFANNSYNNHFYLSMEGRCELSIHQSFSTTRLLLKPGESFATELASTDINQIRASQGYSLLLGIQLSTA